MTDILATDTNLKDAFSAECQENRRYAAFAKKAAEEGYAQIGRIFRAVAQAEAVHAMAAMRVMDSVKTTEENLQLALEAEQRESTKSYPQFLKDARREGHKAAATLFKWVSEVEERHCGLYAEALRAIKGGLDMPEAKAFVCGVCGNTVLNAPPEACPICGSPRDKYSDVP